MGTGASERQRWIVDQVDLAGSDRVLELGCGHGVAATALCDRLTTGSYVGLDRSATMTAAAGRRNAAHVESGRARFETVAVADAAIEGEVDRVVAIHLPVLDRGDPTAELALVRRHLAADGRLYVGFQPLDPAEVPAAVDRLTAVLSRSGFSVVDVRRGEPGGRPTAVVVAAA